MSLLKHHVEVLFTTFPDLKAELYGKGEAHRDDRNLTVRPMIGQIDDSTIAYENESIGIDGTDEPMTVNTSETVNKNGSAVYATNQGTPIQNSSIPLSSRPHLTGNTLVRTPNTAQTQTIGVGTILSSSRGLEPEQVEPHVIQDRPPTKNVTELVSNRTTPDLPVSEVSKVPFVIGHEKGEELGQDADSIGIIVDTCVTFSIEFSDLEESDENSKTSTGERSARDGGTDQENDVVVAVSVWIFKREIT